MMIVQSIDIRLSIVNISLAFESPSMGSDLMAVNRSFCRMYLERFKRNEDVLHGPEALSRGYSD